MMAVSVWAFEGRHASIYSACRKVKSEQTRMMVCSTKIKAYKTRLIRWLALESAYTAKGIIGVVPDT